MHEVRRSSSPPSFKSPPEEEPSVTLCALKHFCNTAALCNISKRWTMPIESWSGALNQFAILFDGRVPMGGLSSNSLTQNPA